MRLKAIDCWKIMTDSFLKASGDLLSEGDGFFLDSSSCHKPDLLQQALDETTNSSQETENKEVIVGTDMSVSDSLNADMTANGNNSVVCDSAATSLNQEQLQHITDYLQTHQSRSPNNDKGIVYYAPTNTRIVYQVLYPPDVSRENIQRTKPELVRKTINGGSAKGPSTTKPRKSWGRKFQENEEKTDGPRLSQEEKRAKKKQRPRTRSGRVSKPPSYMVKDYKRLHHLDFDDEPYDDSDGGYSDFQFSAEEANDMTKEIDDLTPSASKSRNYKCPSCEKAYIGRAGLSRHLKLNPEHGRMEHFETDSNESSALVSSLVDSDFLTSSTINETERISFINESVEEKSPMHSLQKANAGRRRARLKALLKHCRDEEIVEIVMPRMVKTLNSWQFLLKKCEVGSPTRHDLYRIQKELGSMAKKAEEMARNCLVPKCAANPSSEEHGNSYLNVTDHRAARVMGIATGAYLIKDSLYFGGLGRQSVEISEEDLLEEQTAANCLHTHGDELDVEEGSGVWSLGDSGILDILNQDSLSLDSNPPLL